MRRTPLLPLLGLALATLLTTAGCGSDEHRPVDLAGPQQRLQHRAPTAGTAPSERASPDSGTASAPPPTSPSAAGRPPGSGRHRPGQKTAPPIPSRAGSPAVHLLTADRLPGLGDQLSWSVLADGSEGEDPVGACQKTPLATIGAVEAVRRDFSAANGAVTATQVVARFADDKSAWRAHEVLRAWRDDCAQRLDHQRAEVGPLQSVEVLVGSADAYRATYGPRTAAPGRRAGLGIVRHGSWLSVVEVTTAADGYPLRRDPAHVAVRRIARSFG